MPITEWPNRLGFDVDEAEVWKHPGFFRVFTDVKVLRVPYAVTTNPATAKALCDEQGLVREVLDDLDPRAAQILYETTLPVQQEMF